MKIFLGVLALILLIMGGDYYLHVQQMKAEARQEAAKSEAARQERAAVDKKYEDFLNAFIKNVGEKTAAYKARRAVMADLVKPENLKNPKYVEENEVMMRSLSVELNKQMDDIMRAFKDADIEMNKMTTGRPEAERKNTLQAWDNLKERQGQSYVALFTAEEDIIKAYQNLMDFYYERRGIFVYDGQGELIFQNQISKTQETALIKAIADMTAQEAQLNKH